MLPNVECNELKLEMTHVRVRFSGCFQRRVFKQSRTNSVGIFWLFLVFGERERELMVREKAIVKDTALEFGVIN